jgi:NitT/TauT family transport system permease protein
LIIGLIAVFPGNNLGLELACILMIFTSQVWNMAFAYFASLKAVPDSFYELTNISGLSWRKRLLRLELPFSATTLAWNSLISMSGGWFFLTVCESFRLGEDDFRIPGLGSYMALAIEKEDHQAMFWGIVAMITIIVVTDFLIWRPILSWSQKFRVDESAEQTSEIPFITLLLQNSWLLDQFIATVQFFENTYRNFKRRHKDWRLQQNFAPKTVNKVTDSWDNLRGSIKEKRRQYPLINEIETYVIYAGIILLLVLGLRQVFQMITPVTSAQWLDILVSTFYTLLRVAASLVIATLWAVPVGVWIGSSQRLTQIFQPIIQIVSSFPAPMVYPLVIVVFITLGISFNIASIFLMMMGIQWYILFNVLAGASAISNELRDSLKHMNVSRKARWKHLYFPSIYPSLVTGWIAAAGGAWNASIVAEYVLYDKKILVANGLGSMITRMSEQGNMPMLAACILVMCTVVVGLNRTLWRSLYNLADRKFKFER